jgi:hypothetical protein
MSMTSTTPSATPALTGRMAALMMIACLAACTGRDGSAQAESGAAAADSALADARVPVAPPVVRIDEAQPEAHGDALAQQIALRLQACAYDGSPITVRGETLSPPADGACVDLVNRIMRFTGLPQNFNVVEAPVPNAAALILVDDDQTPRRVIAFNRSFLSMVGRATGDNPWAPISIMAHEIGHHLSGHTIMPGGSQPPIELEADKFSGFVLYRMGASLSDAQHAMSALVPAELRSRTHPARNARLDAIGQGWREACEQHAGTACPAGMASTAPSSTARAADVPPQHDIPTQHDAPPTSTPATPLPTAPTEATAAAPAPPPPGSTPSKFSRFVYDEYGLLDPAIVAAVEQRLYQHIEQHQVEIVTVLARDTRGLSTQEYAQAMLRQLRVGKLDVGNGAVLVVAPERGDTAIAMGPGVALQMQGVIESDLQRLRSFLQLGWPYCIKRGGCGVWTESLLDAAVHFADDTRLVDWRIRHFDLGAMLASAESYSRNRDPAQPIDVAQDPTWQKLLQTDIEVLDTALPAEGEGYHTDPSKGVPALLRTPDGRQLIAQVPASLAELMPSGPLQHAQRYSVVLRADFLEGEIPQFHLLSYVAVEG